MKSKWLIVLLFLSAGVYAQNSKMSVAVLDFQLSGKIDSGVSKMLADYVNESFLKSENYILVDRKNLQAILKEQEFQNSDMADEKTAVQVGKLSGAQYICVGSLILTGKVYAYSIKLIHVETSQIAAIVTEEYSGDMNGLFTKIKNSASVVSLKKIRITKSELLLQSCLLPGLGQLNARNPAKGWTFLGLNAAGLGAIAASSLNLYFSYQNYNNLNSYNADFNAAWDKVSQANLLLILSAAVYAGFYTWNILDAAYWTEIR